jgi:phosphoribosyl 1,2-cyclic phosphodiesterase
MSAQLTFPFDHPPGLGIQVLGSSSAGNATILWSGSEAVLLDCGFSSRILKRRLRSAPLALPAIRAVLLTHTHGDHVLNETIASLTALGIPLICPSSVHAALRRTHPAVLIAERRGLVRPLSSLRGRAGPFEVEAFAVPHDSPGGCFGYSLRTARGKITVATDLSSTGNGLSAHFADADLILIESNHDPAMLEQSARPSWLKRRIRERGHLSNEACARFLGELVDHSAAPPHAVLLAHISTECNTPALALSCASRVLSARGWDRVRILETYPDRPSMPVEIP